MSPSRAGLSPTGGLPDTTLDRQCSCRALDFATARAAEAVRRCLGKGRLECDEFGIGQDGSRRCWEQRELERELDTQFGLHLVSRGCISEAQLIAAIERQREERVSLGRLAYERGLMTLNQVVEVLSLQSTQELPYGEIAVSMGYLTAEQRDDLLTQQRAAMISLGDLLVQMGSLEPDVLDAELNAHHAASEN